MTFPVKQTPTDLDLLVQACRNVKGEHKAWFLFPGCIVWPRSERMSAHIIRREYNRLLRLKKKRKKAA